jgi:hypothetical protein
MSDISTRRLTSERVLRMLASQREPRFGADYVPAIRAIRSEAPSVSHCAQLHYDKLGRSLHALSLSEVSALLVATYHPELVDVHEEKLLLPGPAPHPFHGHPMAQGASLRPLLGTLSVAERLEDGRLHGRVTVVLGNDTVQIPAPYVGDLLLYLSDDSGPYCVNWSVKARAEDHGMPGPGASAKRRYDTKALKRAQFRSALEQIYYADAGIRTQQVAGDQIDATMASTLRRLFGHAMRPCALSRDQYEDLLVLYVAGLHSGTPPLDIALTFANRWRLRREDCFRVMYDAIWRRRLRVDLFEPLMMDRPLRPERRDVLDVYADWFRR